MGFLLQNPPKNLQVHADLCSVSNLVNGPFCVVSHEAVGLAEAGDLQVVAEVRICPMGQAQYGNLEDHVK